MFPPAKVKFGQWSYKVAFWLCLAQEAESRSRLIKTPREAVELAGRARQWPRIRGEAGDLSRAATRPSLGLARPSKSNANKRSGRGERNLLARPRWGQAYGAR